LAELDLDSLFLDTGRHSRPEVGMSMLEAVSVAAPGEKFGDKPRTVSPVIGRMLRIWNDELEDEPRQELKPYIKKVIGSILTDDVEEHRAWMATDWLVRVQAPAWLKAAGVDDLAEELENQEPIWTPDRARATQSLLDSAHEIVNKQATKGAEDWGEKGEEAWAEVSPTRWESVTNGIKAAVRSATRRGHIAALSAAEATGKRYAARDAAFEIACDVGWDAAFTIAWKVALPLGALESGEASNAVREALEPTANQLHKLTFELLDQLLDTRRVPDEVERDIDIVGT
jgi:hypothetical protein